MTHPERIPDPITELLLQESALDPAQTKAARDVFLERVDVELARSRRVSTVIWLAPLSVAAAILLAWTFWPGATLSYEVAGAARDGNYVKAEGGPTIVRFSDATEVTAKSGTRLRVVEMRDNGAQVSVESGSVAVRVTHTGASAWNFAAGPFDVHVTGTRFDLAWDAEAERLTVDLHEGSVEIAGYEKSGPVALRAGQRFVGDARARTMQVSDVGAALVESGRARRAPGVLRSDLDRKEATAPSSGSEPIVSSDNQTNAKAAGASPRAAGEPSWTALVSKGKFGEVVARANARGVDGCISSCSAEELGALADAARYTGQGPLAARSLSAMRDRFSGSTKVRAAFLLGRLHEGQGQLALALNWYETSLREGPSGAFAGESLAGKMRTVLGLRGRAAAQPIAREYLKSYPEGVHSEAAKKITQP